MIADLDMGKPVGMLPFLLLMALYRTAFFFAEKEDAALDKSAFPPTVKADAFFGSASVSSEALPFKASFSINPYAGNDGGSEKNDSGWF